jgi:DNA-binding winged helix-turn-helix (wHTH) protein/TolB-like protein
MKSGRFRFGLFEFDLATRELRREGAIIRLQSQPAQVLSCLIEHADKVVSREDLRKAVWGAETFVDFDRGLNFCIGQIRSALGDESTTPRYIRTIPRRGYQFIAPIERIGQNFGRAETVSAKRRFTPIVLACAAILLVTAALSAGYWLRFWHSAKPRPIVAVLRFDNETNDPAVTRFSDGLTDTVVEQLTSLSDGRYDVIGNARILRLPRDQRDLSAIASSLQARYVLLGKEQSDGAETRILIHLIRLPDQKHLRVVRIERPLSDPLSFQSEAARQVGAEFSQRIVNDSRAGPLPPASSQ